MSAEVAVHVGVFPVFWFIHPLVLASALAVWLLGLMLAYLFDWFPRVERWIVVLSTPSGEGIFGQVGVEVAVVKGNFISHPTGQRKGLIFAF